MTRIKEEEIIVACLPSEDNEFYVTWGRELLKNNLSFANEVLRQLVTLNTALLGGGIAFLNDTMIHPGFKQVIIVLFFLSLAVSFVGIMPYQGAIDARIPAEVKRYKEGAFRWKQRYLWTAGGLLVTGFLVSLVGLVAR